MLLTSYLRNPFIDVRISLTDKKKFGEDSIQRITLRNTGGDFDQVLTDTTNVQTALFGGISTVESNTAIQESRTYLVDKLIAAFAKRNSNLNKYFEITNVDQSVYLEVFPQGVTPFTKGLNKSNVHQRMQEMVWAITNHTAEAGGAAVLTEYQDFLASYNDLRNDQLSKIGAVSGSRITRNQAENDWDAQMYKNLLLFATLHPGDPDKLELYMKEGFLQNRQSSKTDGKGRLTGHVSSGGVSAGSVKVHVVDANIADTTSDHFGNYKTQSMPVGTYQVAFSKDGFTTRMETIEVVDEGDTLLNTSIVDPNGVPEPIEEEEG